MIVNKINMENHEDKKEDSELIQIRKKNILNSLKRGSSWVIYLLLAVITFIAVYIRTRNLPGLKDITTNTWTLGPDLDPFLFLRWAEYIVEHGKIMAIDTMRYVPIGFNTAAEKKLLSYMIAWFYEFLSIFNSDITITYAAVIFPVFMFAITCIIFFFLTKEIFKDSFERTKIPDYIALISTLFLAIIPAILPRTIAGIPEKESAGFFFIFLSLYLVILSFKAKTSIKSSLYGLLAGVAVAALTYIWGGVTFVFITVGLSAFILFIIGKVNKRQFLGYLVWIITFLTITIFYSPTSLYVNVMNYFTSTSTIPVFASLILMFVDLFIYDKISRNKIISELNTKYNISRQIISLIIVTILLIIISLPLFGINFIPDQTTQLFNNFVKPLAGDRFSVTVAENRQPFFTDEWRGNFGPVISNIPIFFFIFIVGSIVLFYNLLVKFDRKEKTILTVSYTIFILTLVFSRYSESSVLNGSSTTSLVFYFGGILIFIIASLYTLYFHERSKKDLLDIDLGYIIVFTFFFVSMLAGRGGVRFVMMVVPPASIMAGYFIVTLWNKYFTNKDETRSLIYLIIALLITLMALLSIYTFYNSSKAQAEVFVPSIYQYQWQKAMSWVRDNTPEDAVFSHWWDYGYWVQSIGKRATFLDGGNLYTYWDYLMGRYVLTTPDDRTALDLLYSHNVSYLLIDSTDIGKYSAFSSIGSDENYDRASFIPTFTIDSRQIIETKNGKTYIYVGGTGLDEDIILEENGTKVLFLTENTVLAAIKIDEDSTGKISQPQAVFIQQGNKQTVIPIRYVHYNGELHDFNNGLEAGVFLMDSLSYNNGNIQGNSNGVLFYLSKRTINSLLVRKYLFEDEGNFKLVHNEPHIIIGELRAQGIVVDDFVYYQGNFLGPIKIWKVDYPSGMIINQSHLETDYPDIKLKEI